MDKKEFLESIYNSMPKGLSSIEQARYLYLKLGSESTYLPDFFYGTNQTVLSRYKDPTQSFEDGRNVGVCSDFNPQLIELYKMASIPARLVKDYKDYKNEFYKKLGLIHSYIGFTIDGKEYNADLAEDLMRIQMGAKTKFFASKETHSPKIISEEELRQIDTNLGYTGPDRTYVDEEILKLAQIIRNAGMTRAESTQFILGFIKKATNFEKMGPLEKNNMCRNIFRNLLGPKYSNMIHFSILESNNGNKNINYTPLIWVLDDDKDNLNKPIYFLYDPETDSYIKRDVQQMQDTIQEKGYRLSSKSNKVPKLFRGKEQKGEE